MPVDLLSFTFDPANSAVKEQLDQGLSTKAAAFNLGRYGIEMDDSLRQNYELGLTRQKYEGQTPYSGDTYAERFARRFGQWMPWVSSGLELGHSIKYQSAKEKFAAGKAEQDDLDVIAAYERTQEWRRQQSTGEAIGEAAVRLPGQVAEFMTGQGALKGLGFAERTSALGKIAQGSLATPFVPSSYIPGAVAQAEKSGGSPLNPKNLAPALAYGAAQNAVIGSLGNYARGVPTVSGRLLARTAIGLGEQQALDTASTGLDRTIGHLTGQSLGLDTGYGTLGSFLRGDDDAAKHAIVQALTFAAFSAMHLPEDVRGRGTPSKGRIEPAKPDPITKSFTAVLQEQAAQGVPQAEAIRRVESISQRFERLLQEDPATAWETARDLWREERTLTPAEAEYAHKIGKVVSERLKAEAEKAPPEVTPEPKRLDSVPAENAVKSPSPAAGPVEAQSPAQPPGNAATTKLEQSVAELLPAQIPNTEPLFPVVELLAKLGYGDRSEVMDGAVVLDAGGDRFITFTKPQYAKGENVVQIDFADLAATVENETSRRGGRLRSGTIDLMRDLRRVTDEFADQGIGVSYTASLAKSEAGAGSRASLYEGSLGRRFEKVTEESSKNPITGDDVVTAVWKPKAVESPKRLEPLPALEPVAEVAPRKGRRTHAEHLEQLRSEARPKADTLAERIQSGESLTLDAIYDHFGLGETDRAVLAARMPDAEGKQRTLDDIAAEAKVTKQAIKQAEERALARLGLDDSAYAFLQQIAAEGREALASKGQRAAGELEAVGRPSKAQAKFDSIESRIDKLVAKMEAEQKAGTLTEERKAQYAVEYEQLAGELANPSAQGQGDAGARTGRAEPAVRPSEASGASPAGTRAAGSGPAPVEPARGAEPGTASPANPTPAGPVNLFGNPVKAAPRPARKEADQPKRLDSEGPGDAADVGLVNKEVEVEPGVRFGPQTPPLGPTGQPSGSVKGPFDITAEILKAFNLPRFVGKGGQASAEYRVHARQLATSGKDVGNMALTVHELAHHLMAEKPLDIMKASPEAVRGLQTFDYQPSRKDRSIAAEEGLAEYLRLKVTGELGSAKLTPDQQVAAALVDGWLKSIDAEGRLTKVADLIARWRAGTPLERAASLVSATGDPVPEFTRSLAEDARELFDDRAVSLTRLQNERTRLGMAPLLPGRDPYTVWRHFSPLLNHLADRMAADGVQTFQKDANGSWVQKAISKPVEWIVEGHDQKDLKRGKGNVPSRLGTFLLANHVVNEHARGREVATAEQLADFQRLLAHELATDPAFHAKALESARRYTEISNATLDAMADVGDLTAKQVAAMKAKYPDYVPLLRVADSVSYRKLTAGRTGSGRQFVDPFLSLQGRFRETARRQAKQIFDDAFLKALEQPEGPAGVGRFAIESKVEPAEVPREVIDKILDDMGVDPQLREQAAKEIAAELRPTPWRVDGKNTYTMKQNGQSRTFEIGDKRLYDLLTYQQSGPESNWSIRLGKAIAAIPGLQQLTRLVKTGATTASMAFHPRNIVRDPWHYFQNATAHGEGGFLARLVQSAAGLAKGHGRAFASAGRKLAGYEPSDPRVKAYYDLGGEQLREFGGFAPRGPGQRSIRVVQGEAGTVKDYAIRSVNKVKDIFELIGAGEHGPRLAEWIRALEQMGYSRERVEKALEANPHESPIPLDALLAARVRAANATVDFGRQGSVVHEWNRTAPFLGAHMAGMSQEVRNVYRAAADLAKGKVTPKAAAVMSAFATYLGAELLHWLTYKDDEWYKELDPHVRHRWFVLGKDKDGAIWGVPKPHGLLLMLGAQFQELLRTESNSHPLQADALKSAKKEAIPRLLPVVANEGWDIVQNEQWNGRPIVPERRHPSLSNIDQWVEFRLPYLLDQLTGGLVSERSFKTPEKGFRVSTSLPDVSVDEFYSRLKTLEEDRATARARGRAFEGEKELAKLRQAETKMADINRELRGEKKVGNRVEKGNEPTPERAKKLREDRLKLAQVALGR